MKRKTGDWFPIENDLFVLVKAAFIAFQSYLKAIKPDVPFKTERQGSGAHNVFHLFEER